MVPLKPGGRLVVVKLPSGRLVVPPNLLAVRMSAVVPTGGL